MNKIITQNLFSLHSSQCLVQNNNFSASNAQVIDRQRIDHTVSIDLRLVPDITICLLGRLLVFSRLTVLISYFGLEFNFVSVKCNTNWQPFNLNVAGQPLI